METAGLNGNRRWKILRDAAWIVLFTVLGFCQEERNYSADLVLTALAAFQILEPKIGAFFTPRGRIVAVTIQLFLCWLLVGWSHTLNSYFYVLFLLPIITAATTLELTGTLLFIILACFAYLSFLFFVDWEHEYISAAEWSILFLRLSFFPVVGLVVYEQARGKRLEMARTQAAAEQLAETNKHLQQAQASLRRSERLAALGQLTAGLAHELRNPLGTIKASAELLERRSTQQNAEVVQELAGYITSEVDRTNGLVSRFLDFARPLELHPKISDLRETLSYAASQATPRAEARQIAIDVKLPDHPLSFSFDPDLVSVAVLNLLQNAIDASPSGGRVELAAEDAGEQTRVVVADRGAGIAQEHMESIFNPFFTTKTNGTGLGLALVSKIVDEHQGKIAVQSQMGAGTRFDLLLPHPVQS